MKGVDLSEWNGTVDFKAAKEDGVGFVILREGYRKSMDGKFLANAAGAEKAEIPVLGVYHFVYVDGATAAENAKSCVANMRKAKLDPAKVWVFVDIEYDTWAKAGEQCSTTKVMQYVTEFLSAAKAAGAKRLGIYTNRDYQRNYYNWQKLGDYKLWLADYGGKAECDVQQVTDNGAVRGISGAVDVDELYNEDMFDEDDIDTGGAAMSTAAKVVAVATAEIGYKEKASNKNLDSKTGNAGGNNYTKYARDLAAAGYYNGNKNGFEWCDVFADWVFFKAFGSKAAAEKATCTTGTLGAACPYSAQYYKAQGRYDRNPKVGDQVFFQQGGSLVHTGIVVGVSANQVTVVEGNKGNQVSKCVYNKTNSYIAGYGHPIYGAANDPWVKQADGEYKWKNPATGEFVANVWVQSERGVWYYIGEDGIMCHGGLTYVAQCKCLDSNGKEDGTSVAGWYYFRDDNTNGLRGECRGGEVTITASTVPQVQAVNKAVFESKHNGKFGVCVSINGKPVGDVLGK